MAVTGTTSRNDYVADGSTEYAFTFPAQESSWVQVLLDGVVQGSGYTVALNADQTGAPGGTVTFLSGPTAGRAVRLQRVVPLTQTTKYGAYASFPSATHEAALDKLVMACQQIARDTDDLATKQAAEMMAEAAARAANDVLIEARLLAAVAGINSQSHTPNDLASVLAFGSTTPRTLTARFSDVVAVLDSEALADGVTDCAGAFEDAIDRIGALGGAGTIVLPRGVCVFESPIIVPSGIHFVGQGMRATTLAIKNGACSNTSPWDFIVNADGSSGNHDVSFRDLCLHGNEWRDFEDGADYPVNVGGNTAGRALYWRTGGTDPGPSLFLQNVFITAFSGDAAEHAAVRISGSNWIRMSNVRAYKNHWATGLLISSSDNLLEGFYSAKNGETNALPGVIVKGGVGTRFIGAYFGGAASAQVQIAGSQGNSFTDCVNDYCYGENYQFVHSGGVSPSCNGIIGGACSAPNQRVPPLDVDYISFANGATGNRVVGVHFDSGIKTPGRHFVSEDATSGGNTIVGNYFGTVGAEPLSLTAGNGTRTAANIGPNTVPDSNPAMATHADNAAALAGGLVAGDTYRTASGQVMVVY